ncbi:Glycosyl transferase, family 2 [hydrothermal vent metagenome]|uniref:Glycosyl transferase, family 2 n=1 Tax=hydrothermal vent metagenome TaxID=652676 RepID=A0A3B0Z6Y7_9ZZZZ
MLPISVIIPTFNRAYCLPNALNSVLKQTQPPAEIIVIDDGSTDDTANLIQNNFPQVKYLRQTQLGVSAARNKGINASTAPWIALLDSDDEWLPEKLFRQTALLEENPDLKICHTEEIWVRNGVRVNQMDKHKKSAGWLYQKCLPLCVISPSSALIHRSLFDEVGLFNEQLPACEDYDLWLRICSRYSVAYVETPCIKKYGGHEDQLSRKFWGMDRFRIAALMDILGTPVLNEEDKRATLKILKKKLNVFIKGGEKRGRDMLEYQTLLESITDT